MIIQQSQANIIFQKLSKTKHLDSYYLRKNFYEENLSPIFNAFKRNPILQTFNNETLKNFFRDDFHFQSCINSLQFCYPIWKETFNFISLFFHNNGFLLKDFHEDFFKSPFLDNIYYNFKNNSCERYDENAIYLSYLSLSICIEEEPINPANIRKISTILKNPTFSKEFLENIFINNPYSLYVNKTEHLLNQYINMIFDSNLIFFIKRDFAYKAMQLISMLHQFEKIIIHNHLNHTNDCEYIINIPEYKIEIHY